MPKRLGRWVARDDYIAYLERYAESGRLDVVPGVEVHRIVRDNSTNKSCWSVQTSKGELTASAVVIACGAFDRPVVPPWPGVERYGGSLAHAATYRDPRPYAGQHVLVVGGGASGLEIALLLAEGGAARVDLSVRSGTNLFPRQLGPIPLTPLPVTRHVPAPLLDAAGAVIRLLLGADWPRPLPRPDTGLGAALRDGTEPVVADGIVAAIRDGSVHLVPAVAGFTTTQVQLIDGSAVTPDAVIAATGYRSGVDGLVADLDALRGPGRPTRGDGGPCAGAPGLAFVGFEPAVTGRLPQLPAQARRAARTVLAALNR
jgi:hypothetical protein